MKEGDADKMAEIKMVKNEYWYEKEDFASQNLIELLDKIKDFVKELKHEPTDILIYPDYENLGWQAVIYFYQLSDKGSD